jgi:hypothetical protein
MTTLSAPEDRRKSLNVVQMLQMNSSFSTEDDLYQTKGLDTIKAIVGQFFKNQIELDMQS